MFRNKLSLLALLPLMAATVNATSTITLNTRNCTGNSVYTTISSPDKIKIYGSSYNAPVMDTESGTIAPNSYKKIKLYNKKLKHSTQIIFVDYNCSGKKLTSQLWLTQNKLCQITNDNKECYKYDYHLNNKQKDLNLQLCVLMNNKSISASGAIVVGGKALEKIESN